MSTTVSHGAGIKAWELPRKLGAEDEVFHSEEAMRPLDRRMRFCGACGQAGMPKEAGNPVAGLDPRL
jgi:hypothetical protein